MLAVYPVYGMDVPWSRGEHLPWHTFAHSLASTNTSSHCLDKASIRVKALGGWHLRFKATCLNHSSEDPTCRMIQPSPEANTDICNLLCSPACILSFSICYCDLPVISLDAPPASSTSQSYTCCKFLGGISRDYLSPHPSCKPDEEIWKIADWGRFLF